jgi:hypothetical protein
VSDHLAKEAARLKADEMFNLALDLMRSEALNALAVANADDKTMILRLQQSVAAIDEIRATLDRYIMAAGSQQENAGSFA